MPINEKREVQVPTKEFVGFIQSILQVYRGGCTFNIRQDHIDTLVLSEDNASIILYAKIATLPKSLFDKSESDLSINIRDLNKFILLTDFAKNSDTFVFDVQDNYIYHRYKNIKEAKFVLDETPARKINKNINVEWFRKFNPHFKTTLSQNKLKDIGQLSVFASDSDKVYIYEEDGSIVAELNDRQKSNIDSIRITLTDKYEGHILDKIILDIGSLAVLTWSKSDYEITMEVAKIQNNEALFFTIQQGGVLLKYLFASKIR